MKKLIVFLVIFLLVSCAKTTSDPIPIVQAYFEYWNEQDVEGALSMISDHPKQIEINEGIYLDNKDDIRVELKYLFNRPYVYEISDFEVDGNTVTYNYQIFRFDNLAARGRSQAIIEDGKIVSEFAIGPFKE
jgi:hypothetical protein